MKINPRILYLCVALLAAVIITVIITRNNEQDTTQDTANDTSLPADSRYSKRDTSTKRPSNRDTTSRNTSEWEEQIDSALASDDVSNSKASQKLLAISLNSKAPIPIRIDALEHALNLIDDKDFSQVLAIMGTGSQELPKQLVQTILDDTLNRDEHTQLSTSLIILEGSHKKIKEEAIELLEFHLDEEHGKNITKWKQSVQKYLAAEANKPTE